MAIQRATQQIRHYRGDAYTIQWTVLDYTDGVHTPVDLTNYDIMFQIRERADSSNVLYTPSIVKTNPTQGIFQWKITPTVSEDIGMISGVFDIQLKTNNTSGDNTQILTFITGTISTTQDVSRDPVVNPFSMESTEEVSVESAIASSQEVMDAQVTGTTEVNKKTRSY